MTSNCTEFENFLLEDEMEQAARHASECDSCLQKLADWKEISATAQTMHEEWPSDTLWPRIQRAIATEKRQHIRQTTWRVAAAVILTVGLGAGSWFAVHRSHNAAFDREIIRVSALDEVERAEQAHMAAIDHLAKVAEPKLENAETPLMVSYKEKLMLLDDAIAECQTNIDRNRQNAHLRKQLLAIYTQKQQTLQDALREGNNHVSNQ